jgi:polar amino acid transport system permease protein
MTFEFFANLNPGLIWEYRFALLNGLGMTLFLTVFGSIGGLLLGLLLAVGAFSRFAPMRGTIIGFVEVWRNTPLLVQLMWVHFALPVVTRMPTTSVQSGLLALTLGASAYFAEIIRGGINAVPKGQWEAGRALGLAGRPLWLRVVLPQAFRIMVPPLVNMVISIFKATTILSLLAIPDLMQVATRISNFTFKPVEIFTFAALVYLLLGTAFDLTARRIERHFSRPGV